MMTKLTILLGALTPALLAGCSAFGGKDKFDCPNLEVGAACLSARQIYDQTHVSDRVQPLYKDGKRIDAQEEGAVGSGDSVSRRQVASNSYRPPLPEADAPLPVRMPPKIMRIRVFPWEDAGRDLNTGGYVYTEIADRMWTIGEEQIARVQSNVVTPLATFNTNKQSSNAPLQVTPSLGKEKKPVFGSKN